MSGEIVLKNSNKSFKCRLLLDIYKESLDQFDKIRSEHFTNNKFESIRKIVDDLEVNHEINFYFLNELKTKNITYLDKGEKLNYRKNFNLLKDTLTNNELKLLKEKNDHENPILDLKEMLLNIINKKPIEEPYNLEYNFPNIFAIEKVRRLIYKRIIYDKKNANFSYFEEYINKLNEDADISKYSNEDYAFCPKLYLFVLILTEMLSNLVEMDMSVLNNYFLNKTTLDYTFSFYSFIKIQSYQEDINYYCIQIKNKKNILIKKNEYFIETLARDITDFPGYPLNILLMRNETFPKYINEYGEKGFLKKLGLYDSFVNYVKRFLKSNSMKDLFSSSNDLENISKLISNDKYLDEILSTKHFKFLPFYNIKNYFGFTNKQILISIINSIPDLAIGYNKIPDENNMRYNVCLLFTIAIKFITTLHEIVMHLTSGYINFITGKEIDSKSPKGNNKDGGYYFESKIIGGAGKFDKIKLNHVIALLNGNSCQKSLKDFRNDLNNEKMSFSELCELIKPINNSLGFLGDFLEKFPIDFTYFKNINIPDIYASARKSDEIFIEFGEEVISSC